MSGASKRANEQVAQLCSVDSLFFLDHSESAFRGQRVFTVAKFSGETVLLSIKRQTLRPGGRITGLPMVIGQNG